MGEIEQNMEGMLRSVQQIGQREENKIYIEETAYQKIRTGRYDTANVYLLMGHTECHGGKYATFVEAAVHIKNMEFVGAIPQWNNRCWNDAFSYIKEYYEELIIVGWALERKGDALRLVEMLETIHREQFGGMHQILFVADSIDGEEAFFENKNNHLRKKTGFYIYRSHENGFANNSQKVALYAAEERDSQRIQKRQTKAKPKYGEDIIVAIPNELPPKGSQREKQRTNDAKTNKGSRFESGLIVVMVATLLLFVGVGIYRDQQLRQTEKVLPVWSTEIKQEKCSDQTEADTIETKVTEVEGFRK